MPHRVNTTGDIGTAKAASDSYDVDNIFLTDEGWVYRHYKKADKTVFWDEIICAGEVDSTLTINSVANTPVDAIGDLSPNFEVGDGVQDVEYSPDFRLGGGGAPTPPAVTIGTVTLSGGTAVNELSTHTYSASVTGTSTPSYALTSSAADSISGMLVTYSGGAGTRTLTVTATDATAADSPATGTLSVTVS